jgi:hypothetical protein
LTSREKKVFGEEDVENEIEFDRFVEKSRQGERFYPHNVS